MPSQTWTPSSSSAEVECVICYEGIPAAIRVELRPCLHSNLCKPCLTSWIATLEYTCPVCRADIHGWIIQGVEVGIIAPFPGNRDQIDAGTESVRGAFARVFGIEILDHVEVEEE